MASTLRGYGIALGAVGLATIVALVLAYPMRWEGLGFLAFPFAVLAAASYGGLGPGLLATVLSALIIAYALARPLGSMGVEDLRARIALSLFVMTSAIQSTLIATGRRTHRSLAEINATLSASRERYRILFERNPVPMFLIDVASHKILAANQAALVEYGYTQDELVGLAFDALFVAGAGEMFEALSHAPGAELARDRWHHVTREGERRDVEGFASYVPWLETGAILVACHDVTERLRSEEALHSSWNELRRAKAVAEGASQTKDRLIRAISHELRTPLTPVLLTVSAMERNGTLPESLRGTMRMIRRNVELEAHLVDELLDVSRIAGGELPVAITAVDPRVLIERAIAACGAAAADRNVKIEASFEHTRPAVSADEERLESLLRALLGNGIESVPPGGAIRIVTRDAGPRVAITVSHEGAGMTEEETSRAFEPFAQLEDAAFRRVGRLGLTLAIGKRALEACGGSIVAKSDGPTRGSAYAIELPVADASVPLHKAPLPKRRVLLVEDDADSRNAAARLLASVGHEVTAVGSAREALSLARNRPFDVIVSDVGLPDQSGLDLMSSLRAFTNVPAIAFSGFSADADVRASLAAGFFAHLTKPITLADLTCAIERATGGPPPKSAPCQQATRDESK